MMYSIYIITNKINNKIYVGYTLKGKGRWTKHLWTASAGPNCRDYSYIHSAMNKYGSNNFLFEIIESHETASDAKEAEIFWIAYLKQFGVQLYNLTISGDGNSSGPMSKDKRMAQCSLNTPQCIEVQKEYLMGATMRVLSIKYNCCSGVIYNIIIGKYFNIQNYSIISEEQRKKIKKDRNKILSKKIQKFSENEQQIIIQSYLNDFSLSITDLAKIYKTCNVTITE